MKTRAALPRAKRVASAPPDATLACARRMFNEFDSALDRPATGQSMGQPMVTNAAA